MASPQIITPSLLGTQNLQTKNLVVVASSASGTVINLGVPPNGAEPEAIVVIPNSYPFTLSLIDGALGLLGGTVVSGYAVVTQNQIGFGAAKYAGGYWILDGIQ